MGRMYACVVRSKGDGAIKKNIDGSVGGWSARQERVKFKIYCA